MGGVFRKNRKDFRGNLTYEQRRVYDKIKNELLADLPDDENKQDALNYYQDYLEEAGENTAAVLKEFGSPERIASMIRCDLNGELNEGGDFTDHGIEDTRFKEPGYDVAKRLDLPEVMGRGDC